MGSRLIISAAIFIILTALKLLSPVQAGEIKTWLTTQMAGSGDIREQVTALGSSLTGNEPIYVSEADAPEDVKVGSVDVSADFDLESMVSSNLSRFLPRSPEAEPVSEQKKEKQAAFLELQSAFSDYAVPANVSYDVPVFSFECVCPADAVVSSGFGYRVHPTYGDVRFHYGADYALYDGESILAFAEGRVITVQTFSGYGLTLVIDHGGGVTTLYAHCSSILVAVGDTVSAGQTVALAGHTGRVTGPHLHFEVEVDGVRFNPELCF